jgi:hypothetical protein
MNPLTQNPRLTPGRYHVGDRVQFRYGFPGVVAEVVEDRGPIGVGGRRLYGVRFRPDEWNEITTEVAEEELEPAPV